MRLRYVCLNRRDTERGTKARAVNGLADIRVRLICLMFVLNAASLFGANISGVWANEGGDKVSRDELRATKHTENVTGKVINRAWDGTNVLVSGARSDVVRFDLILEAAPASPTNGTVP